MATPMVGKHAYVREAAIPNYVAQYGPIRKDDTFVVTLIDSGRGRDAVHLKRKGDGKEVLVWRGHVKAFPRCDYCQDEGHTRASATATNCAAMRRGTAA